MSSSFLRTLFLNALVSSSFAKDHQRRLLTISTTQPSNSEISITAATQEVLSPTSNIPGATYSRFIQIWLENTDYSLAAGDPNLQYLATHGITLTNYWALTHPSQPNYLAAVSGDHFGLATDSFTTVPANLSTVADLLDTKGIAYGEYQEAMPYPGYQGDAYDNALGASDYVRKHNPLVLFDSVTSNSTQLALLKNFTSFHSDLAGKRLPQWAFLTPNMTNNGHDTSITTAGRWARSFLEPLLSNTYFMRDTLVLLTFDESQSRTPNRVFALLLGGAVPYALNDSQDDTFYTHYSALSSLELNFGLPSLGRWDCGANVFAVVADQMGYANCAVDIKKLEVSESYPGPLAEEGAVWPRPDTEAKCVAGKGVLEGVVKSWGKGEAGLSYSMPYPFKGAESVSGTITGSARFAAERNWWWSWIVLLEALICWDLSVF